MNIVKEQNGKTVRMSIEGRLDTTTAPQLEAELKSISEEVNDLVFDFEKLEYISSAGLRVLLATHKAFDKKGALTIINVNSDINEVFDITGFSNILSIK